MINLGADELRKVAEFLDALTAATQATGVQASGYSRHSELTVADMVLTYAWDDATSRYVVEQDGS